MDDFRSSGEANTSQCPTLYSRDTAIEFHYLLITVLSGYSVGLQGLADFSAAGPDKEAHCHMAWLFTFFLWRIAHSSILWEHLAFLHAASLLSLEAGCGEANSSGNADRSIDEDVSIIHLQSMQSEDGRRLDVPLALVEWMRLLVSPITSLEMVSSLLHHEEILASTDFQIQMVTLQPTGAYKAPWKPVIKRTLKAEAPSCYNELDAVLGTLMNCVKEGKEKVEGLTIFHHFGMDIMTVTGNVHCEAALPYLAKHLSGLTTGGKTHQFNVKPTQYCLPLLFSTVPQTSKHQLRSLMVSKPSCPVCWELLSRFDPDVARLGIHRRQHQVYPVQLPPWICDTDARAMVEIFRKRLYHEISIMMQRRSEPSSCSSSDSTEDLGITSGERHSKSVRKSFQSTVVDHILNMPLLNLWKR